MTSDVRGSSSRCSGSSCSGRWTSEAVDSDRRPPSRSTAAAAASLLASMSPHPSSTRSARAMVAACSSAFTCALLGVLLSSALPSAYAADGGASVCFSSNCLLASPGFTAVYPSYGSVEVGYDYSVTLFRFFIAMVCILVAVWMARWYMDYRGVAELWAGVREGRVVRIPPEWASARSSITREVISAWMARQEQPSIVPTSVRQIRIPVHTSMAMAKLQLAPSSLSGGAASGLASPSGVLSSPSARASPGPLPSPSATSPSPPAAGLEYALKLVLSSEAHQACLVEVFFGVQMKTLVQLISAYDKFKQRHTAQAQTGKKSKSAKQRRPSGKVHAQAATGASGAPAAATAAASSSSPPQQQQQQAFMSAQQYRSGGGTGVSPLDTPVGGDRGSRSPRSPGGGVLASAARSNRVTPAPLRIAPAGGGLPGVAPSPHNSPSYVTAESESKHVSHLSLRERTHNNGPASPAFSQRDGRLSHSGLDLVTHAHGHANGNGSSSPLRSLLIPSPSPTSSAAGAGSGAGAAGAEKGGVATALATLQAHEGSQLFRAREYLHALPPTLFGPGTKRQASLVFAASLLHDALREASRCPIVIFLTAIDERSDVRLGAASSSSPAAGGGSGIASPSAGPLAPRFVDPLGAASGVGSNAEVMALAGELTIVQFAPPPSQSAAAAAAAKALASLPAPAITTAVHVPEESPPAADGESKEDGGGPESPKAVSSPGGGVTSPNAALNDATTSRARFERQLIVTPDQTFEMEELYGLDESDGECIICMTDVRDTILLPCKHVCVCKGCHASISKCPICRERIGSFMRFTPKELEQEQHKPDEAN